MYFIKIKIFISTHKKIDYYIGLKDASKYLLAEINITVNESQYPTDWEPWPYMPLSSSGHTLSVLITFHRIRIYIMIQTLILTQFL